MNILSQKETNSIYGGGFLNNIAKKTQEKFKKTANNVIGAVAKITQDEVSKFKIV